jgi:hypothetical protein
MRMPQLAVTYLLAGTCIANAANPRLALYNLTARTDFTGVYLAPPGTDHWGPNEALTDKDKSLDSDERLVLKDVTPGRFDLKLVDRQGRTCIIRNIDLAGETSFDIRDEALTDCR